MATFTKQGRQAFIRFLRKHCNLIRTDPAAAQAWLDSLEYADWTADTNTTIEINSFFTKSGNPELYPVPISHVTID